MRASRSIAVLTTLGVLSLGSAAACGTDTTPEVSAPAPADEPAEAELAEAEPPAEVGQPPSTSTRDNEVPELERRHNVTRNARRVIDDFSEQHPEAFGGGWIDPDSGDLVLATTSEDEASTFLAGIDPDLRRSVRIILVTYTDSDLADLRATVEAHLLGPDGFTPGVGSIFIDPRQNAVVVGVVEGPNEEHARAVIEGLDPDDRRGVIVITTGEPGR